MQGQFTGRHMLFSMIGFFGVIIAVNLVMAVFANTSWTGLVVKNSYVASQEFNGRIAENRVQARRGWTAEVTLDGPRLRYRLTDANGKAVIPDRVSMTISRPTHENADQTVMLESAKDGAFLSPAPPAPGIWNIKAVATWADGTRDARVFRVTVPR
jgi:nitrogen fixation protein FixH